MHTRNLKYNTKLKFIISCISLIICISFIKETYAKYITEAQGTADMTIAKWKILVNNQDVISESDFSESITPTFENNLNIKDGVIAPYASGYFDILIDPTNTDVSFSYEITTSINTNSAVTDLIMQGYSLNEGVTIINFNEEEEKKVTGSIPYSEDRENVKLRIYVTWYDGENEEMDNSDDTEATKITNAKAQVNTTIRFIQTPFIEPVEPELEEDI